MKALVIIEHMLNNELDVPTKKKLKAYGHNIIELYDCCASIAVSRNCDFPHREALNPIQQDLLSLLSEFAQITRYHNLDALNPSHTGNDPLEQWGKILLAILERDVSQRQKEKILRQANFLSLAMDDITFTLMHGLDKKSLSTEEALALPELHDQAAKYAILHLINVLMPLKALTSKLSHLAYTLDCPAPPFPQMHDFIGWLWNDRQYVLRKKRWP